VACLLKVTYLILLGDIENFALDILALVLADKLSKILLSSPGDNEGHIVLGELAGEALANAGCGTNNEDFLVI
jgi:hypothetical protein